MRFLAAVCISVAVSSQSGMFEVRNSSGLRLSIDADDRSPALVIVVPDGPDSVRSSKILFPEHVTVRAHGQSNPQHLYLFRPGPQGYSPEWTKVGSALQYARDFGKVHFVACAELVGDGIVFHYEFANHSAIDYDIPRLERTYVHHKDGFDLLASETPARLTIPLKDWFPARYLAFYTVPVPAERVQHRGDGITYYYKSRPVDVPMIATLSQDRIRIAASFARDRAV